MLASARPLKYQTNKHCWNKLEEEEKFNRLQGKVKLKKKTLFLFMNLSQPKVKKYGTFLPVQIT